MIEWFKTGLRAEIHYLKNPEVNFAYITLAFTFAFVCWCIMSMRSGDMMVTP